MPKWPLNDTKGTGEAHGDISLTRTLGKWSPFENTAGSLSFHP